jgi:ribose 5-phosphate isomerase B
MTIFIGADHRGFELKDKIEEYLREEKNIRVEDVGNYQYDPEDDFPDFAKKVAQAVLQNVENHLGIVICGSGAGVGIVCNRYKGIRCGTAINVDEVKHIRSHDHINVLAIGSDYVNFERAKEMIEAFLETPMSTEKKYLRRIKKIDSLV